MKPIAKRWPDNVEVFHIADLPVDAFDQGMMRLLRKIADEMGWTVEEVIVAAIEQRVERCKAEKNLGGKIIRFPKLNARLRSATAQRSSRRRSEFPRLYHSVACGTVTQTQSATQSDTPSIAAVHIAP